ncbi:hypothetical protein Pcinc_015548 [Petrolisthes cinctipes]|uniref:Acyl-CoA dehydrogenase/oxidase N-terminal domain-containing protein n=1 Tax=Petrolisthes cinctipes TaxID=88211 RepID=A0AAE1FU17_PETCI|nr:hypothetical protein Pcinc_015548 [Petrolisthes cinctipes]
MKKWGRGEFWGLSSDFDHDFALTDTQKKLLDDVRELCRVKIKPLAIKSDRDYVYPRESMNALAEMGLLGLIIPKELGGLGESHVFCSMFVETLARYGCPSTAMIYTEVFHDRDSRNCKRRIFRLAPGTRWMSDDM